MNTLKSLISKKRPEIYVINPHAPVYAALEIMAEKNVGALVVMQDDKLVGMISERDYARKVILKGKSSRETPVSEVMSSEIVFVRSSQTVMDCMQLMSAHHIRHLPVVDNGKVVGVVSSTDLLNYVIQQQEQTIRFYQDLVTDL